MPLQRASTAILTKLSAIFSSIFAPNSTSVPLPSFGTTTGAENLTEKLFTIRSDVKDAAGNEVATLKATLIARGTDN